MIPMKVAYCEDCKKPFVSPEALLQHKKYTLKHKRKSCPSPSSSRISKLKTQPSKIKSQVSAAVCSSQPAKPQKEVTSAAQLDQKSSSPLILKQPQSAVGSSSKKLQVQGNKEIKIQVASLPWSTVLESEHETLLETLSQQCHSRQDLENSGYIVDSYNASIYMDTEKCKNYNKRNNSKPLGKCVYHPEKRDKSNPNNSYKCCNTTSTGCRTSATHDFQKSIRAIQHKHFRNTPPISDGAQRWSAVTLDCEMAGVSGGASELIQICVADFITGKVLMDQLIYPYQRITQMRQKIHGITKHALQSAANEGRTLSGWRAARAELWKYIDDNTIIVGHSLEHDLTALRIIHPRIVDAEMLTRYKIAPKSRKYGLKALCSELLKLEIRANKKAVHDCMEDVMATREVVLFCLRKKREFGRWAGKKRREEEERKKEVERLRKEKMAKKEAQKVDEKEKVTQDKTDSKDNMLKKDRAVKQENILQTNTIAAKEKAITKSWVDTTQSEWYRKRILEMGLRDRAAKKIKKDVEDEDPEAGLDDDDDSYWDDDDSEDEDYEDEGD